MPVVKDPLQGHFDPVPASSGVGLRAEHYDVVLEQWPDIGWFEVHPENYMCAGGPPHDYLSRVRERYPLSLHGVGLSIGGEDPPDNDHLLRLKQLCDRYRPGLISEHLAWSRHGPVFFNDLLPLPLTSVTLGRVVDHVDLVQEVLGRRVLIENPATYVKYQRSDLTEIEFLAAISERTGCGLLLDVNNVFVSATNHGYSAEDYIDAFPTTDVGEIHLAGHTEEADRNGRTVLIDTHDTLVADPVWELYARAIGRLGAVSTLIEWDADLPAWEVLFGQAKSADRIAQDVRANLELAPSAVAEHG